MSTPTPIWYPTAELDAQLSHCGWGAFALMAGSYHFGPAVAVGILLTFASAKEFIFDVLIEKDSFWSSALDWGMYLVGGAIGYFTWWLGT